jgi:hypothetical protein
MCFGDIPDEDQVIDLNLLPGARVTTDPNGEDDADILASNSEILAGDEYI